MKPRTACTVASLMFALAPGLASAQTKTDPAAAQVLFYDARALMQQGRYAEACPKLEESLRLDAGLGTQFNLADCNEHIGKIATAWAGFLEVAAQAKSTNQTEREKFAKKRASALEPRLPKLVVDVPRTLDGAEVRRDGVLIGPAAWGSPIPIDPGTHKITARAPGKQVWETTIFAAEGKSARVSIPRDLPSVVVASAPVLTAPESTQTLPIAGGTTEGSASPASKHARSGDSQRAAGWIVTGLGVASVAVSAGFGFASLGKRNDSRDHCIGDACDADGVAMRDAAIRNGNIATITAIAGGVAVAGGLALVLTAPKKDHGVERAGSLRAAPSFASNGGALFLSGTFQ